MSAAHRGRLAVWNLARGIHPLPGRALRSNVPRGGPVGAMPKHKQAGHTTVLTKFAQTAQQNACNAGTTLTGHW